MQPEFIICGDCLHSLKYQGIAQELYVFITTHYVQTGFAYPLAYPNDGIIKYLERRGFIITFEDECYVYAKPYIKHSDGLQIFCRCSHKINNELLNN